MPYHSPATQQQRHFRKLMIGQQPHRRTTIQVNSRIAVLFASATPRVKPNGAHVPYSSLARFSYKRTQILFNNRRASNRMKTIQITPMAVLEHRNLTELPQPVLTGPLKCQDQPPARRVPDRSIFHRELPLSDEANTYRTIFHPVCGV